MDSIYIGRERWNSLNPSAYSDRKLNEFHYNLYKNQSDGNVNLKKGQKLIFSTFLLVNFRLIDFLFFVFDFIDAGYQRICTNHEILS